MENIRRRKNAERAYVQERVRIGAERRSLAVPVQNRLNFLSRCSIRALQFRPSCSNEGALDQLITLNKLSALRAELDLPQLDARDIAILAQAMAQIRTILTNKDAPKWGLDNDY